MCLIETSVRVHTDKKLSYKFPITRRRYNTIVFVLGLEYAVKNAKENRKGLKLSCTYQLLVYDDCNNLLEEAINTSIKCLNVKQRKFIRS